MKGMMKFIMIAITIVVFGFSAYFMNGVLSNVYSGFSASESKLILYLMIPSLGVYVIWNQMTRD